MKMFMHALSNELRRSLLSLRFLIVLTSCVAILYQPAFYLEALGQGFAVMTLYDAMMSTLSIGYYVSAASLMCALAYSDSYAWERLSGFYPYYLSRVGRRRYIAVKAVSTAVAGGLAVSGGFAVFCAVQVLLVRGAAGAEILLALRETGLFFTYGATWALAGLAVSALIVSPIAAVVMPFCLTQGLWVLYSIYDMPILSPKNGIALMTGTSLSLPMIACQQLLVALISVAVFAQAVERSK